MKQKHIQLVFSDLTFTGSFFLQQPFHYRCPFQKTDLPPLPSGSSIRYINTQPTRTETCVGCSLRFYIFLCSFLVNSLPRGSCSLIWAYLVIQHEVCLKPSREGILYNNGGHTGVKVIVHIQSPTEG